MKEAHEKHGENNKHAEAHSSPSHDAHDAPQEEHTKPHHTEMHRHGGLTEKCSCGSSFHNLLKYVSNELNDFISLLFILFTLGAIYGWYVASAQPRMAVELMAAPLFIGAIAYYNRDFATLIFGIVIGVVILI